MSRILSGTNRGDDLSYLRKLLADDLAMLSRLGFYLIHGSLPVGRMAASSKGKVGRV